MSDKVNQNDPVNQDREKKPKKKKGGIVLKIGILVCLAVMAFSAYKLISTMLAYKAGEDEYNDLLAYTSPATDLDDPTELTPSDSEETVLEPAPIDVDFESLQAINEDIVGWLYIGALDLSYPIVQGDDDDYYLHRTFEKQYNFAGSIFVEAKNSDDFSDPNTIVYGHNMKNGSMFGTLRTILSQNLYEENPYFWILTPDGDHKYQMFSLHVVKTGGEVYTLFEGTDETFVEWAESMQEQSAADLEDVTFDTDSKIATLSTCTGDSSTRFVVQGLQLQ